MLAVVPSEALFQFGREPHLAVGFVAARSAAFRQPALNPPSTGDRCGWNSHSTAGHHVIALAAIQNGLVRAEVAESLDADAIAASPLKPGAYNFMGEYHARTAEGKVITSGDNSATAETVSGSAKVH